MRIAQGIEMLEISATVMGKINVIHPTLIWDEHDAVLVDAGYPGPLIRDAFENACVPLERLTKIIVTHQDIDHIGGLPTLLQGRKVEILANEIEKPFIQGEKTILKLTPEAIERAMASMPANVSEQWRQAFRAVLENPPKAPVDRTVADGESLPFGGGITVINTPGHTPGHISLYHEPSKTLIAGDAMNVANGQLLGPNPQYTNDMNQATQSLRRLTDFDIQTVICYHGGLYQGDANRRIAELAGL